MGTLPSSRRVQQSALRILRYRFLLAAMVFVLLFAYAGAPSRGAGFFWTLETVEVGTPSGLSTSIALDADGRPHIAYLDRGSDAVKYTTRGPEGWGMRIVESGGGFTGDTNLVLDSEGRPHISYFNGRAGFVTYAAWNDSAWRIQRVERALSVGANSLAVDSSGGVHVAYSFINGKLRYATWDGMEWVIETVDPEVIVVEYVSLAVDSKGRPHIAYYAFTKLRYASWDGSRWNLEVVDRATDVGWHAELALDASDAPHIAYRDAVSRELKYAQRADSTWGLETVDSGGDVGWDIGIAVDGVGAVHISYYERLESELRHAYRFQDAWVVEKVDSEGVVGWHTDVAVDAGGTPHLSYHDWSLGSLKYATGAVQFAVKTLPPTALSPVGATLRGDLVSLGNLRSAQVAFEWRPSGSEGWNSTAWVFRASEGEYERSVSGLTPEQDYEYRAKAQSSGVIAFGETLEFRTHRAVDMEALLQSYYLALVLVGGLLSALLGWALFAFYTQRAKKGRPEEQ